MHSKRLITCHSMHQNKLRNTLPCYTILVSPPTNWTWKEMQSVHCSETYLSKKAWCTMLGYASLPFTTTLLRYNFPLNLNTRLKHTAFPEFHSTSLHQVRTGQWPANNFLSSLLMQPHLTVAKNSLSIAPFSTSILIPLHTVSSTQLFPTYDAEHTR